VSTSPYDLFEIRRIETEPILSAMYALDDAFRVEVPKGEEI
jgi:hypothetical protein